MDNQSIPHSYWNRTDLLIFIPKYKKSYSQKANEENYMYKIRYSDIPNMGDQLNKCMLEELFNISVERADPNNSNMSAIGSGMSHILMTDSKKGRIKQSFLKLFKRRKYYVWGTGFMNYQVKPDNPFIYSNTEICAVRGKLTLERVKKILNNPNLDVPLADGGLLAKNWVGEVEKKYKIGIIPHFKESDHPLIESLKLHYDESTVIDLKEDPKTVVEKIAQCETVLSSSLHGLIVADSYHIPNMHIMFYKFGEKMLGDGYKFMDYYSSYGLKDTPIILSESNWPTIEEIIQNYNIPFESIEEKKKQLVEVFPKL